MVVEAGDIIYTSDHTRSVTVLLRGSAILELVDTPASVTPAPSLDSEVLPTENDTASNAAAGELLIILNLVAAPFSNLTHFLCRPELHEWEIGITYGELSRTDTHNRGQRWRNRSGLVISCALAGIGRQSK